MSRHGWGPALDDEQRALVELIDNLAASRLARCGDEYPETVAAARRVLAEHGLWTVGADETTGGGGADLTTTVIGLARLAGTWPALAWGSVQAHAAAIVLRDQPAWAGLLSRLHGDGTPVAVVDLAVASSTVVRTSDHVTGFIDRIDPVGESPHLVLLLDATTALVLEPDQIENGSPLRRTGLDGALTRSVRLEVGLRDDNLVEGVDAGRAATMLQVGGAAIAAGIASAAAEAALAYSSGRVQFGAPLTALSTVRDSLMQQASGARDSLVAAASVGLSQPQEAAAVLLSACDRAIDVAAAAVQSHGGYGYMADYPVEALLRDAVSIRCAAGATDAVRFAGRVLAGL